MILFNKKKKYEALNAQSKQDILARLEAHIQRTTDVVIAGKLNDLKTMLVGQGASSSEQVALIDAEVLSILADASKDIAAGNAKVAGAKLDRAGAKLKERAPLCAENSAFLTKEEKKREKEAEKVRKKLGMAKPAAAEKLYSPEELLDFTLMAAAEKKERLQAEQKRLHATLTANPNDPVALSRWRNLKVELQQSDKNIEMLSNESYRNTLITGMQSLTAEQKRLIATRQIGDEQFDLLMQDYQKMLDQQAADSAPVQQAAALFMSSGNTAAAGAGVLNDPDFIAMGSASQQKAAGGIFNDPDFIAMGDAAGAAGFGTQEVLENIDAIVRELEKSEMMYTDKLEDASADLQEMDMRMKQLLKKREGASASECLVLDGEIDRLNAERVTKKNGIKRYRQALAINTEKLSLARALSDQRDINEINSRVQEMTNGQFINFEEYAMDLRKYVEDANAQLDQIGTVNAVANGADVNMNTMSGREADGTSEFDVKDEDKYKALEEELGMRKE